MDRSADCPRPSLNQAFPEPSSTAHTVSSFLWLISRRFRIPFLPHLILKPSDIFCLSLILSQRDFPRWQFHSCEERKPTLSRITAVKGHEKGSGSDHAPCHVFPSGPPRAQWWCCHELKNVSPYLPLLENLCERSSAPSSTVPTCQVCEQWWPLTWTGPTCPEEQHTLRSSQCLSQWKSLSFSALPFAFYWCGFRSFQLCSPRLTAVPCKRTICMMEMFYSVLPSTPFNLI